MWTRSLLDVCHSNNDCSRYLIVDDWRFDDMIGCESSMLLGDPADSCAYVGVLLLFPRWYPS